MAQKYEVNIDLANDTKKGMAGLVNVGHERVLNRAGAFACLYDIDLSGMPHPVLVLKTEEPGSKQLLAAQHDRIEGVCHDMVNHLVNDCIVAGARPLTVQDAVICGRLDGGIVTRIVRAISEACTQNECLLTGGETSEQPGVIGDGTYILTSSIVGVVDRDAIIDGNSIRPGDVVLGLASNGVHTNGYTLVRSIIATKPRILEETADGLPFLDAALLPHRPYYTALKGLFGAGGPLKGLAHITGGGICENLNRVLPQGVDARIDLSRYKIPQIFGLLRRYGEVGDAEMLRTFNMGVGMAAVVAARDADAVAGHLRANGVETYAIGEIVAGEAGDAGTSGDSGAAGDSGSAGSGRVVCEGAFPW